MHYRAWLGGCQSRWGGWGTAPSEYTPRPADLMRRTLSHGVEHNTRPNKGIVEITLSREKNIEGLAALQNLPAVALRLVKLKYALTANSLVRRSRSADRAALQRRTRSRSRQSRRPAST